MKYIFDRRTLLKTTLAVPCAIAGYFIYDELTEYDGPPRTVGAKKLPPPKPVQRTPDQNGYNFFVVGDTGLASKNRQQVIEQMIQQSQQDKPDSVFMVGDNFYDKGVTSTTDPLWQTHFEKPFSEQRFPVPFYSCLGNHDYYGNIQAQIEYSWTNQRWNMPSPYYSFVQQIDVDCLAEFFVLDTTPIEEGDHTTRSQVNWLTNKLANSTANYKIVVGHHPLYSGGEHGSSRRNYRNLAKLFDRYSVDLYVCGHDHDLQLHDTGRGWLHLISGAGSKLRSVNWVRTTMFAEASSGFARVSLTRTNLAIEIYSTEKLLFSHQQPPRMLAKSA